MALVAAATTFGCSDLGGQEIIKNDQNSLITMSVNAYENDFDIESVNTEGLAMDLTEFNNLKTDWKEIDSRIADTQAQIQWASASLHVHTANYDCYSSILNNLENELSSYKNQMNSIKQKLGIKTTGIELNSINEIDILEETLVREIDELNNTLKIYQEEVDAKFERARNYYENTLTVVANNVNSANYAQEFDLASQTYAFLVEEAEGYSDTYASFAAKHREQIKMYKQIKNLDIYSLEDNIKIVKGQLEYTANTIETLHASIDSNLSYWSSLNAEYSLTDGLIQDYLMNKIN